MRTTITLDDHVLSTAKIRAEQRGTTLSAVVEDALREVFSRPVPGVETLAPLPAFRGDGLQPGVDIADGGALWDLHDEEVGWRR